MRVLENLAKCHMDSGALHSILQLESVCNLLGFDISEVGFNHVFNLYMVPYVIAIIFKHIPLARQAGCVCGCLKGEAHKKHASLSCDVSVRIIIYKQKSSVSIQSLKFAASLSDGGC